MKTLVVPSLVFFMGVGMSYSIPSVIDTAYNPATGHNYLLLETSDWLSAEASAVVLGGHLVTINNLAENTWLHNQWGLTRSLMIGLTDQANEGVFTWTSGEVFSFSNWNAGEPNDGIPWGYPSEDYVYMYASGWGTPGRWNDYPGGANLSPQPALHGVVEVPEPSIGALLGLAVLLGVARPNARASTNTDTTRSSPANVT